MGVGEENDIAAIDRKRPRILAKPILLQQLRVWVSARPNDMTRANALGPAEPSITPEIVTELLKVPRLTATVQEIAGEIGTNPI